MFSIHVSCYLYTDGPPLKIYMKNAVTIDVEDYFQVTAFERHVRREEWHHYPMRVKDNTFRILDMLDELGIMATFFILGWVAKHSPAIVKEIQRRGHEIACHGYAHQLVYQLEPEKFRADISISRQILEEISGERVTGYRAPSYSITKNSFWAFNILIEEGFTYDSSIFPVIHDTYGIPDANRFPGTITCPSGKIREFPLSTLPLKFAGKEYRLPIAGGGYLRLFPVWMVSYGIEKINRLENQPAVLYFHPWEIDPGQPRIRAGYRSRFRHYINLHKTEEKLRILLAKFDFGTMREVLDWCVPS